MTEYPYVRAAFINAIAEEGTKEEAVSYLQKKWNENCALRAETERLTASNAAMIRERSSMIHTHRDNINRLRADLDGWKQAARQAEAERDEAREQVAAAFVAAADKAGERCAACGVREIAGLVREHVVRLTPDNAKTTLEAYGRAKMREGMKRIIDRLRHEGQINPSLTYADAIEWAEYVLAAMKYLK